MGILEPTTFFINYDNNVDNNPNKIKLIAGQKDFDMPEILPCNFLWEKETRAKMLSHIKEYYENVKKIPEATQENPLKSIDVDETKLKDFEKLLEYEKVRGMIFFSQSIIERNEGNDTV